MPGQKRTEKYLQLVIIKRYIYFKTIYNSFLMKAL